jgi:hypothetical protein
MGYYGERVRIDDCCVLGIVRILAIFQVKIKESDESAALLNSKILDF